MFTPILGEMIPYQNVLKPPFVEKLGEIMRIWEAKVDRDALCIYAKGTEETE